MATLTGSAIADSYDQLLALPAGGINGATLVALTDGKVDGLLADHTFALELSTGEVKSTGTLTAAGAATLSTSVTLATGATVTGIDNGGLATGSATLLATQGAIKTYVDAQVGASDTLAEVLANGNTTGSTNIIVTAGQSITTDTISETTAAAGVTIDSVLVKDNTVTATTFTGALTGNVTGNVTGDLIGDVTGNADTATLASTVTVADTTDTTSYVGLWESATGSLAAKSDAALTYNAGTGVLSATGFIGPITGAVTGNVTGNLTGNVTGNVTGNLTGDVTGDVTGDLTGNADTVTTNANLTGGVTSVGNAATVITNANLTGGVTSVGNAATVITNANLTGDVTSSGNATTYNNVIPVAKGGTTLTGFTAGDILYADTTTTLAKLAKGSDTEVLTLASGVPTWAEASGGGGVATVYAQQFTGDGDKTAFTLLQTPAGENNTQVYISGVYQQKSTYTVEGATLTFATAPADEADNIEVITTATSSIGTTTSDLVTFSPSGTGATDRTVQAKLRDTISVKDFGATGDGSTDDTDAIMAAIAAVPSTGAAIFFPSGTYLVGNGSTYSEVSCSNKKIHFKGDGPGSIIRKNTANSSGIALLRCKHSGAATGSQYVISDLFFNTGATGIDTAIKLEGVDLSEGQVIGGEDQVSIYNVTIRSAEPPSYAADEYFLYGLHIKDMGGVVVDNVVILNNNSATAQQDVNTRGIFIENSLDEDDAIGMVRTLHITNFYLQRFHYGIYVHTESDGSSDNSSGGNGQVESLYAVNGEFVCHYGLYVDGTNTAGNTYSCGLEAVALTGLHFDCARSSVYCTDNIKLGILRATGCDMRQGNNGSDTSAAGGGYYNDDIVHIEGFGQGFAFENNWIMGHNASTSSATAYNTENALYFGGECFRGTIGDNSQIAGCNTGVKISGAAKDFRIGHFFDLKDGSVDDLTNKVVIDTSASPNRVEWLDFTNLESSANSFRLTAVSHGFELGNLEASNTPYIDFHSSGNDIDYDSRIIGSGGDGVVGSGTIGHYAATHVFHGYDGAGAVQPGLMDIGSGPEDGLVNLGGASNRWDTVYAATGTINTSDERQKQDITELSDAEKRVGVAIKGLIRKFRFKSAVTRKGEDKARYHIGVVAQDVQAAFEAEGLDATEYGLFCYDEWEESSGVGVDLETTTNPAGNSYGVRYDELLAFVISAI